MSMESAAVSALSVSSPINGGQSMSIVVVVLDRRDGALECRFAAVEVDEFRFRARQVYIRRDNIESVHTGMPYRLFRGAVAYEQAVHRVLDFMLFDSESARRVALRVVVYDEHFFAERRKVRGKIDARRRLAYSAFLICYRYSFCHCCFLCFIAVYRFLWFFVGFSICTYALTCTVASSASPSVSGEAYSSGIP